MSFTGSYTDAEPIPRTRGSRALLDPVKLERNCTLINKPTAHTKQTINFACLAGSISDKEINMTKLCNLYRWMVLDQATRIFLNSDGANETIVKNIIRQSKES